MFENIYFPNTTNEDVVSIGELMIQCSSRKIQTPKQYTHQSLSSNQTCQKFCCCKVSNG